MKKKLLTLIILMVCVMNLSGCSKFFIKSKENSTESNEEEEMKNNLLENETIQDDLETEIQDNTNMPGTETELTEEEKIRLEMLERSLLGKSNNYRMKKVIERARAGEDITIAYIGGSITEGYNAGTGNFYAKLTYEYFVDTYGSKDKVHYVNAGMSGTPSSLGLIRSDRDIFKYEPDVVFIEFAVNDSTSPIDKGAFESLVRKSLMQENEPAVILLFSVTESGYTCQDQMQVIGFNYQVPMISVKAALDTEFEAGRLTWTDWASDEAHPNESGHRLYSDFIIHYWESVDKEELQEKAELPSKLINNADYTGIIMGDKENAEVLSLGSFKEESGHPLFRNGWVKSEETIENEGLQFTFTGKSLFLVYKETNLDSYGTAEVYVNGELITTLSGKTSSGWNNPATKFIFREKEAKEYVVEIKMQEGEEEKAFALLALGYCP